MTFYDTGVPNVKDIFASSQDPFLKNFKAIYDAFAVNHIALDKTNAGNHFNAQMVEFPNDAKFTTNVGEISLFCKNSGSFNNMDQLYLQYQGGNFFPLTTYQIYTLKSVPDRFFTCLPGKVLCYFGIVDINFAQGVQFLTFSLFPKVARSIISLNFIPLGTSTTQFPPLTTITVPEGGIISKINLFPSGGLGSSNPTKLGYIILANI